MICTMVSWLQVWRSVHSICHFIITDRGWSGSGQDWKAHPGCLHPSIPSLSPSQSLDRSSCPSPQLRKASASKKLLRRKHFVYWFRLLIRVDSCIDLNSPGREETGQETFPWAMPCLSERI